MHLVVMCPQEGTLLQGHLPFCVTIMSIHNNIRYSCVAAPDRSSDQGQRFWRRADDLNEGTPTVTQYHFLDWTLSISCMNSESYHSPVPFRSHLTNSILFDSSTETQVLWLRLEQASPRHSTYTLHITSPTECQNIRLGLYGT